MKEHFLTISKVIRHFHNDSLYRNSVYLMLSTAIMAFFGFIFWVMNARLYSTEEIGAATALISLMSLISSLSLLGLNTSTVRFLPERENKNSAINSSIIIVIAATTIFTVIYLIGVNIFSPNLSFIRNNLVIMLIFIFTIIANSLNSLSDSFFNAFRKNEYVLYYYSAFNIAKLLLPIVLVPLGALGIYFSLSAGVFTSLLLTFFYLYKNFAYKFKLQIDWNYIKSSAKYSLGNYLAGIFAMAPTLMLPVIISSRLSSKESAYYYICYMIISLINIIPFSIGRSFFAESSNDSNNIRQFLMKSTKFILFFSYPITIFVILFGRYFLFLFGKEYYANAGWLLSILAISSLLYPFNTVCGTFLNIKKKIKLSIFISFISMVLQLILIYYLINFGLFGIATATILGQLLTNMIFAITFLIAYKSKIFNNLGVTALIL